MIKSFACKDTLFLFRTRKSLSLPPEVQDNAYKKLAMLNGAKKKTDLRYPPSNHLKKLKGKWNLKYSIRINLQYRITFIWNKGNAYEVCIEDYH